MLNNGEEVDYPPSSGSFLVHLHIKEEEARKSGIKHFGHEHSLTFKEDVRNGFEEEDVFYCHGCGLEIRRSGFICCMEDCCFNLHEFCASLPKEMKDYPQHPQHPLILYTHSSNPDFGFSCDVCKNDSWSATPFCYHCAVCKFNVDLRCASMSFLVCNEFLHRHELTAQLYPASFLCCYCGEYHGKLGMSYQCKTCSFWIHEQCYSLPKKISHGSHVHPLKLFHLEDSPKSLCGVCEENINHKFSFYGCFKCNYPIHIKCSTKEWYPIKQYQRNDKLIQFPLPSSEVVRNMLAQFIKNICQWKDEEDKKFDILNHPSHDHPLTLEFDLKKFTSFNTSRRDYEVCNGCMLPLLNDAPFYCCNMSTCNFVLHKWCAKLPRELRHHAHTGHTLILQEKMDECFGFFRCKGCRRIGNGFAYKCNECEGYYLDVRCATLPRFVNHDTHDHPLLLKYGRLTGGCISCRNSNLKEECNCKTCNYSSTISPCSSSFSFGCDACHFSIDTKCLILPRKITHWYDKHGFKLTHSIHFSTSNDNQGAEEYHCEFCEGNVNPEKWIYYCFECDQCVGANCVRELLGLFPNLIKFGGLYDSPHHLHPLTCIIISNDLVCNRCHENCFAFEVGFQCEECKIVFGLKCAYSL